MRCFACLGVAPLNDCVENGFLNNDDFSHKIGSCLAMHEAINIMYGIKICGSCLASQLYHYVVSKQRDCGNISNNIQGDLLFGLCLYGDISSKLPFNCIIHTIMRVIKGVLFTVHEENKGPFTI